MTNGLAGTLSSAPSEWYRWEKDLRANSDIQILLSIDPSSFPLGTGPKPHEIWHSGYYPVVWTNKRYRMVYMNMGHNDMDYENKTNTAAVVNLLQPGTERVDYARPEMARRAAGGTSVSAPASHARLTALDALRGLIMVIMALDHTRDFIHAGAMSFLTRRPHAHDADHLSHPLGHAHLRAGLHVQRRRRRIPALAASGDDARGNCPGFCARAAWR